ncbi:peptidoglycan recognition protein family protein [Kribbella kalugense]|uniref:LGFP repeat-containing protein n=1 Tax=Kribbella kalugense TaxID=2512221 RepID=A0A4R7ZCG8_9ACTN|nr:peptidoglycan recognition protein [Kribbella kalugense]TDW15257.1 LGFP repeat-containing protein [Kribbella kalugense]
MRRTARLLPLVLTAATLIPLQHNESDPSYQEIPLDGPTVQARTKPFGMVAVTWPEGVPNVTAKVRVERDGKWTDWESLSVEDEHGPDPLVPEGIERGGTEPLWVGNATGVQASAATSAGTTIAGAKVVLIQPGVLASDASDDDAAGVVEPAASRAPYPMPLMVSRKRWGADERLRSHNGAACTRPKYTTTVLAAFVHHTADRNDYTRTQVPAMVRAMYAYHVKSRGWCDLGYNFLVDRFGRVFEGRYGGAQWPVLGAHTASFNSNSFGVALIGNFEKAAPPQAMLESTARVLAWKLDANYRSPLATITLDGSRLHTVSGHRDTKATACPGTQLYNKLGWLKQRVNTLMSGSFSTPIYQYARKLGFRNIGQPFWGEHRTRTGWATYFATRDVFYSVASGTHSTAGAFRTRFRRLGAGSARLGLPVTDAYRVSGGSRQKFQRGWLVWDRRSRQVHLVYGRAV